MIPKEKICKDCGRTAILFGWGLCRGCYKAEFARYSRSRPEYSFRKHIELKRQGNVPENPKKKPTPEATLSLRMADKYFSRYIRLKYAFLHKDELFNRCYTCNAVLPIKEAQAGHLFPRERKSTRFHENNVRPQCPDCNQYKNGQAKAFKNRLKEDLGAEYVDQLEKLSKVAFPLSSTDLRTKGAFFIDQINEIQKTKGKVF